MALPFLLAALALSVQAPMPGVTGGTPPSGYFINTDLVQQIVCPSPDGKGEYLGTSWFAKDGTMVTAAHVVEGMKHCTVRGKEITVTKLDHEADYAIFTVDIHPEEVLSYTCEAFKKDEQYLAVGYALGQDKVVQPMRASSEIDTDEQDFSGEAFLVGKSYEGMSGGPIFNMQGQVVGIVNGGDGEGRAQALSRSLTETALCGKL